MNFSVNSNQETTEITRLPLDQTIVQNQLVKDQHLFTEALDSIPDIVLILNQYRQIVYFNTQFTRLFPKYDSESVLSSRPGEFFHCIHQERGPDRCGSSDYCQLCGAYKAIIAALNGADGQEECRIRFNTELNGRSMEHCAVFNIKTRPVRLENELFIIFVLQDISDYKRKLIMEQTFFHDILNTAGSISGLLNLAIDKSLGMDPQEIIQILAPSVNQLVDEIEFHRDLLRAETGELEPAPPELIDSAELIDHLIKQYSSHEVAAGRKIRQHKDFQPTTFKSSRPLLGRVIGNMIKNALEACKRNQEVLINCQCIPAQASSQSRTIFEVINPGVIPPDIQKQIFQRAFSTKGAKRGLGTYSMKLLSENYLAGKISFQSGTEKYPASTSFKLELS